MRVDLELTVNINESGGVTVYHKGDDITALLAPETIDSIVEKANQAEAGRRENLAVAAALDQAMMDRRAP